MLPLTGRYPCQLDDNHRLAIPAKLREQLGQAGEAFWYVSVAERPGCLALWPEATFVDLAQQLPSTMLPSDAALRWDEFFFSHAERVRMDKQGRLVIPEMLIAEAGLGKDLMMVGQRNRLNIWPRTTWEDLDKQHLAQQAQIREQARAAMEAAGRGPRAAGG